MNDHLITAVWVPGHPATKGSLTFKGRGHVEESVKGSEEWRALVTKMVREDIARRNPPGPGFMAPEYRDKPIRMAGEPIKPTTLPVLVRLGFWLDHPDPCGPTVRAGDIDKLSRNVLDALTDAGAYIDDNQVQSLIATKHPSNGVPGASGAKIEVMMSDCTWLSITMTEY
jgi:Holliday junction resolvase RusA-like endonuclease